MTVIAFPPTGVMFGVICTSMAVAASNMGAVLQVKRQLYILYFPFTFILGFTKQKTPLVVSTPLTFGHFMHLVYQGCRLGLFR